MVREFATKEHLTATALEKVRFLSSRWTVPLKEKTELDLETALSIRNEIAHYFPRSFERGRALPHWMERLLLDGTLAPHAGDPRSAPSLTSRLRSYRLCIWCCESFWTTLKELLVEQRNEPELQDFRFFEQYLLRVPGLTVE
jgi:hypothetical protein